jgi:hypothetical protein
MKGITLNVFFINDDKLINILVLFVNIHYYFVTSLF